MKILEEDIYNLIIGRTTIVINRALLRNFRKHHLDITMEQWSVLAILWKKDGCSQLELGTRTFREKAATTRLLDKLEQQNIIVRIPDRNDRRIRFIHLTAKGKAMEEIANKVVEETYKQAAKEISDDDMLVCKCVLTKIYDNLNTGEKTKLPK